jgi:hypothetical protein
MPDARGIEEEDCWMGYKMEGAALERQGDDVTTRDS